MKTIEELLREEVPDIADKLSELREKSDGNYEEILVKSDIVDEDTLLKVLSRFYEVPVLKDVSLGDIDPGLIKELPISFSKKFKVFPFKKEGSLLKVVFAPPLDLYALDEIKSVFSCEVEPYLAKSDVVIDLINRAYEKEKAIGEDIEDSSGISEGELQQETKDLLDAEDEAPIIRFVNSLLFQAVKERASDIHIECFEKEVVVRFRKDGLLHHVTSVPKKLQSSIISRIKIMAELDIAEKRKPQDGRIRIKVAGRDVDIRISTVPTSWGESVVMRLLDRSSVILSLEELGIEENRLKTFDYLLKKPHGIILVTGPTGSGKTTTLYASLERINSPERKIITIEDPVEYQIHGINQIQVNTKVGLTFANGLRSILRQDPDVILVGEIRDRETADISIHASLTGHLVFSTLHTNDSATAITRLLDMEIEPFLVASSLLAVIAQRLVRVLCEYCKEPYIPNDKELLRIGIDRSDLKDGILYKMKGCEKCLHTGYSGRMAIFEILLMNDDIRNLTLSSADSSTIKRKAIEHGLVTLKADGADKVKKGLTTVDEVLRVTEEDSVLITVD